MRRGIPLPEFDREFTRLGGTIERDGGGHNLYKYPGLPVYGTHSSNREAPGKLVSMLRKMEAGVIVSPERVSETEQASPTDDLTIGERHRFIQRPNPSYDIAVTSPHRPESVLETVERLAAQKAADRDAAIMQQAQRNIPSEPAAPYVSQVPPVRFAPEPRRAWDAPVPHGDVVTDEIYERCLTVLKTALEYEEGGAVKDFETQLEWEAELTSIGWHPVGGFPEVHEGIANGDASWKPSRFVIVVVRPSGGLSNNHTWYIPLGKPGGAQTLVALHTVGAPTFAHFMAGWERGLDFERRACLAMGAEAVVTA